MNPRLENAEAVLDRLNKVYEVHNRKLYRRGRKSKFHAGGPDSTNRCWCICLNRKLYKEHRLLFLMDNGRFPFPGFEIDHIDRNPLNNARDNLREVTKSVNHLNSCAAGVSKATRRNSWQASTWLNYKRRRKNFKLRSDAETWYKTEHVKNMTRALTESNERLVWFAICLKHMIYLEV